LNKMTLSDAIIQAGKVQTWLLRVAAAHGKMTCDQLLPIPAEKNVLLTGLVSDPGDTLIFSYGYGNVATKTESIDLSQQSSCSDSTIERINMLQKFSVIQNLHPWDDVLEFGLKEKIVTANTSFIV